MENSKKCLNLLPLEGSESPSLNAVKHDLFGYPHSIEHISPIGFFLTNIGADLYQLCILDKNDGFQAGYGSADLLS